MLRKKDGILIACVIIAAVVLATALRPRDEGERLRITVNGVVYGEYALSENRTIEVSGEWGYNQVVISAGAAYMAEADCPDKYCMEYEPISKGGQVIVCLPHRLVVEALAREDGALPEVDAVSR